MRVIYHLPNDDLRQAEAQARAAEAAGFDGVVALENAHGPIPALAVAAHQIPQEVGDFAILLDAGYSRTRAFVLNALSASTCVLGAIAVYGAASWTPTALPYVLAVAAGSFLYVAMSDLIPGLHREAIDQGAVRQVVLIAAGVGTIMML